MSTKKIPKEALSPRRQIGAVDVPSQNEALRKDSVPVLNFRTTTTEDSEKQQSPQAKKTKLVPLSLQDAKALLPAEEIQNSKEMYQIKSPKRVVIFGSAAKSSSRETSNSPQFYSSYGISFPSISQDRRGKNARRIDSLSGQNMLREESSDLYESTLVFTNSIENLNTSRYFFPPTDRSLPSTFDEKPAYERKLLDDLSQRFAKISKIEASKVNLSKELYLTDEQREMKHKILQELKKDYISSNIRKMIHNRKEQFEIGAKSKLHLRIEPGERDFPMSVKIEAKEGDLETLVSKLNVPDENNYDYRFFQNSFNVKYQKTLDFKQVFLTIIAAVSVRISIIIIFTGSELNQEFPQTMRMSLHIPNKNKSKSLKYVDPFPDFDPKTQKYPPEIEEILRKRRQRALTLAGNKDLILENIKSTPTYPVTRKNQLEDSVIHQYAQRNIRIEEVQQKRKKKFQEFKTKKCNQMITRELRHHYLYDSQIDASSSTEG